MISGEDQIYECTDGRYYGNSDIWQRFESGEWRPVDWDRESGTEWVETVDGKRLTLEPVSVRELPEEAEVIETAAGISVEV